MTFLETIILICWVIFLVYWFGNWKNVKPTQEQKFNTGKFRWFLVGVIILIVLNHFYFHNMLNLPLCRWNAGGCHVNLFSSHTTTSLLVTLTSMVMAIGGLVIAILARKTLAGNWSSSLDLKKGHELVTTGVYTYVRHPIYTGVLLLLFATLLAFESVGELLIFLFIFAFFLYRIKREEELMIKTFPNKYPEYKQRTKALIPFIF